MPARCCINWPDRSVLEWCWAQLPESSRAGFSAAHRFTWRLPIPSRPRHVAHRTSRVHLVPPFVPLPSGAPPSLIPYGGMDDGDAGTRVAPRDVHDFWPRLLASPILGALVVNLSGLIDNTRHSSGALVASYAWFAVIAFVVWEGNRRLYFRLPRREDWLFRPWSRLGLLLSTIILFTIPVAGGLLWIWRAVTEDPGTRQYAFATAVFAIVSLVIAITHVYETVFLLREWESDRLRSARLEHARLQTELESLGREVDPHFLFNNLNALAHLVDQRSDLAPWFIRTLSATYRYVLECRGRPLVRLAVELEALERHRALANVRYGNGIRVDVQVRPAEAEELLLPPVSLAELFQNALKHNTVAADMPLGISVRVEDTTLIFENDLRSRLKPTRSTGIGLANLAERFRIGVGRPVVWVAEADRFVVRLPLVKNIR